MLADEGDDVGLGPDLGYVLVGYAHALTVPRLCAIESPEGRGSTRHRRLSWLPCGENHRATAGSGPRTAGRARTGRTGPLGHSAEGRPILSWPLRPCPTSP